MQLKPIIFSSPMVQAILAGRKTMTRRIAGPGTFTIDGWKATTEWWSRLDFSRAEVRDQSSLMVAIVGKDKAPADIHLRVPNPEDESYHRVRPKIAVGDVLWVKEAFRAQKHLDDFKPADLSDFSPIQYEAGPNVAGLEWGRYRNARFMPEKIARLWLRVVGVKVERLWDISGEDVISEGTPGLQPFEGTIAWASHARTMFAKLWNDVNGDGVFESNPWVACYTFERTTPNGSAK